MQPHYNQGPSRVNEVVITSRSHGGYHNVLI